MKLLKAAARPTQGAGTRPCRVQGSALVSPKGTAGRPSLRRLRFFCPENKDWILRFEPKVSGQRVCGRRLKLGDSKIPAERLKIVFGRVQSVEQDAMADYASSGFETITGDGEE
jgi:hypothetical protein